MAEGLPRPEGVNISKGQVMAEGMERSHVAAENIGEQRRMLRMKFYVTVLLFTCCLAHKFAEEHHMLLHIEKKSRAHTCHTVAITLTTKLY